jgi:hypothetical protein
MWNHDIQFGCSSIVRKRKKHVQVCAHACAVFLLLYKNHFIFPASGKYGISQLCNTNKPPTRSGINGLDFGLPGWNPGWDTRCPARGISWFSSVPACKCQVHTSVLLLLLLNSLHFIIHQSLYQCVIQSRYWQYHKINHKYRSGIMSLRIKICTYIQCSYCSYCQSNMACCDSISIPLLVIWLTS